MAMISIRNLKICYGEFEVVPDLSVDIEKGEFFTLLGPSGCGKTTVLRAIAGFVPATSGQIFLNGEDITHKPAEQRDVGIVFQNYALFPHMTILREYCFWAEGGPQTIGENLEIGGSNSRSDWYC